MRRLAETICVHIAATGLLETQSWDFGAVHYRCIDAVCHESMPFHAPAFQLGATLSRLGWFERAAQAFEVTLR